MQSRHSTVVLAYLLAVFPLLPAALPAADTPASPPTAGWRGNWTGLYPDADPPVHWSRIARSAVASTTCQAAKPADGAAKSGQPVANGLIRDWLIVGPFPVADSVRDFDKEQMPGEAALRPAEGAKAGAATWKRLQLIQKPDYERWGTTEFDWVDLADALEYKPNQVAYAHTYLHCNQPGKVVLVIDHGYGLKVWANGKLVYNDPKQAMGLGSYVGISRQKQELICNRSPRAEFALEKGWNRLLVKVSSYNAKGYRTMKFAARLIDAEPVAYQEQGILWATRLPERTNASPIIVGDRLFTPAEPDELLCLDKQTGKVLWRRLNTFYHAMPEKDRAANPVLRDKIDPLVRQLEQTADYEKGLELRREIQTLLMKADTKKYGLKWDGHLAGHFGIVGFTTTPVSDGKHVWLFVGQGVVACYDLNGRCKWITRLAADEIRYSCSPALIGGKLICIFGGMHALDAETGKVAWTQPEIGSIASLIPARVNGTDVVATRDGRVMRVSDGKLLWSNPRVQSGDTGWAAPVFCGDVMYVPWYGVCNLIVVDFSGALGDSWKPKVRDIEVDCEHRRPNGEWLDRNTASSPIIHEGRYYNIDQYGVFYAVDLKSGKTLYRQDVGFDELHHYNAIGVGASPTLAGKHLYVIDNQGMCVVLEPGPEFRQVGVNRIESLLARDGPIPPQEILANGAPVFDGRRMYVRGELHLFCIGKP